MKIQILLALMLIFGCELSAQNTSATAQNGKNSVVGIVLKNNSILPQKITLVSYEPQDNGSNGTTVLVMAPYSKSRRKFPIGTKLFLATDKQVETVMSGKGISSEEPFLVVTEACEGKVFVVNGN